MKFKVEFTTDNAAFEDNADELPTILEGIANKIAEMSHEEQQKGHEVPLLDSNGNYIGSWEISK